MRPTAPLADDFYLWDTPGMLWPRISVVRSGFNLAASGAVGRNAYDEEEVALELLSYLKAHYAAPLEARFRMQGAAGMTDEDLLAEVGRKRGAILGKGKVNLQKAAEIVIYEFRAATLGRVTLETPEEFAVWVAEAQAADALRLSKKQKKEQRKAPRAADPD